MQNKTVVYAHKINKNIGINVPIHKYLPGSIPTGITARQSANRRYGGRERTLRTLQDYRHAYNHRRHIHPDRSPCI